MDIILQNPAIANLPVAELESALSAFAVLVTVATLALAAQHPFPGVWGARHPKEKGHSSPSKGRGILAYFVKDRFPSLKRDTHAHPLAFSIIWGCET